MAKLTFVIEWEPAEGIAHAGLAATWARIEIRIGDRCITTLHDTRTGATRSGVYGPAMLVAEWIVRNFWFLLYEGPPPELRGAAWRRRHSLAAGREGMSFPDLVFFRDERSIVAEWYASSRPGVLPVHFVESGRAELESGDVRQALACAVDAVVEQLRGVQTQDAAALRADWDTIAEMAGDDRLVCSRAARLGIDALDETEMTANLESCLTGAISDLPEATANDILDAQIRDPQSLASSVATIRGLVVNGGSPLLRAGARGVGCSIGWGPLAYQVGYAAAREMRARHGSPDGVLDLDRLFVNLNLRDAYHDHAELAAQVRQIQAIVGASSDGAPRMFVAPRPPRHARFLRARGLFAMAACVAAEAPRALTNAGTRLQVASRAFAAELLAPAHLLRSRLAQGLDDEHIETLAEEFDVATAVIEYQIRNHNLTSDA
jgi:hypothetical protein